MKSKFGIIVLVLGCLGLAIIAFNRIEPNPVAFKRVDRDSFFGIFAWLGTIAIFLERAVEVIVSVLRDAGASPLAHAAEKEQDKLDEGLRVDKTARQDLTALHAAQKELSDYRAETKNVAIGVSFLLGLIVSVAGVRVFASIVAAVPPENWIFPAADMLVTGAVLAGGAEGIHQMANVFDNFMGSLANKVKS